MVGRQQRGRREASHAGSWYSADAKELDAQLDGFWAQVPDEIPPWGGLPAPGARVIIAPHAGFSFSGATGAWAYKALDLGAHTKKIFVLGPSHHAYFEDAALSPHATLATPLGDLSVDGETCSSLFATGAFHLLTAEQDEAEHSLELHFPWIRKLINQQFGTRQAGPPITPIVIGNTSAATERELGAILAPYLEDAGSAFIVSSDFAHWGTRFRYTYYLAHAQGDAGHGVDLSRGGRLDSRTPIHESIERVDRLCMQAIESGSGENLLRALEQTGNTVCGRHPIAVVMAAMETLKRALKLNGNECNFRFLEYARSSLCQTLRDSSVSYASACAVVNRKDVLAEIAELELEHWADEERQDEASEEGDVDGTDGTGGTDGTIASEVSMKTVPSG